MEMSGQFYALAPYSREKTLVPIEHEAGSGPEPFRTVFCRRENLLPSPGFEPRAVQPDASRYTDWVEGCRYTYFLLTQYSAAGGRKLLWNPYVCVMLTIASIYWLG
jgi:hypothetical protein